MKVVTLPVQSFFQPESDFVSHARNSAPEFRQTRGEPWTQIRYTTKAIATFILWMQYSDFIIVDYL